MKARMNTNGRRGQVSLELAVAMITLVVVLMMGSFRLFIWANQRLVRRQSDYEASRLAAGSSTTEEEIQVNDSAYPPLDILGSGN